ncbi:MAG: class II glutamine amidotransferase [Candidatus Bathyarchaeia archaeon]
MKNFPKIFLFYLLTSLILLTNIKIANLPAKSSLTLEESHQCRLWGMTASPLPENVVLDHLVNLPYSLKNLGAYNPNGWGLAFYNDTEPTVSRGKLSANVDPAFTACAEQMAHSNAHVGVGHVRLATSGATDIPNPHPFIRYKGGKWWAFGHNGGLNKSVLMSLVGEEYLAANPPTVGDNWTDPKVVDSDLYMLYVLKCIEENTWNVTEGVAKAVRDISQTEAGSMNFFLTNGEALWGLRRGYPLYYCYNETANYVAIASQPPESTMVGWTELDNYDLIVLVAGEPPKIISDIASVPEFSYAILFPLLAVAALLIVMFALVNVKTKVSDA